MAEDHSLGIYERIRTAAMSLVAENVLLEDDQLVHSDVVQRIESEILKNLVDSWIEPKHYFCGGVYVRETMFRADCFFAGRIHRKPGIAVLVQGDVSFWTKNEGRRRVQAPFCFINQARTRLAVYAHRESVVMCIHASNETDLGKLEDEMFFSNTKSEMRD